MAKNLVKFFIIVDEGALVFSSAKWLEFPGSRYFSRFLTQTWDKRGLNNHDDSDNDIVRKKKLF